MDPERSSRPHPHRHSDRRTRMMNALTMLAGMTLGVCWAVVVGAFITTAFLI